MKKITIDSLKSKIKALRLHYHSSRKILDMYVEKLSEVYNAFYFIKYLPDDLNSLMLDKKNIDFNKYLNEAKKVFCTLQQYTKY